MEEVYELDEAYDLDEPVFKISRSFRWKLWHLYNELENCSEDRVNTLRTAIVYLGGSLEIRDPIPAEIASQIYEDIPVRQPAAAIVEPAAELEIVLPLPVEPVFQQMSLV